jgi:hypothetical protein
LSSCCLQGGSCHRHFKHRCADHRQIRPRKRRPGSNHPALTGILASRLVLLSQSHAHPSRWHLSKPTKPPLARCLRQSHAHPTRWHSSSSLPSMPFCGCLGKGLPARADYATVVAHQCFRHGRPNPGLRSRERLDICPISSAWNLFNRRPVENYCRNLREGVGYCRHFFRY